MAALSGGAINTTETTRSIPSGTPLPAGIYQGVIVKTGQKPTAAKNGNPAGMMVEVEFDISSPQEFASAGRKFWDRFNILNASADAMRIGRECLADLALACGYEVLEDDEQMIGHEVIMKLGIDPAKPYTNAQGIVVEGKPQNRCLKYWVIGTNVEEADRVAREAKKSAVVAQGSPASASAPRWPTKAAPQAAPASAPQVAAPQQPASTAPASTPAAAPAAAGAPWKRKQ